MIEVIFTIILNYAFVILVTSILRSRLIANNTSKKFYNMVIFITRIIICLWDVVVAIDTINSGKKIGYVLFILVAFIVWDGISEIRKK